MVDTTVLLEAEKLIRESTEEFLIQVKKYRQNSWFDKNKKDKKEFSLFSPLNDEYFELKHFERKIVDLIREYLVLGIFNNLLQLHNITFEFFERKVIVYHESHKRREKNIPYEFLITKNNIKTGYRFDYQIDSDWKIRLLLKLHLINEIEILIFDESELELIEKNNNMIPDKWKPYEKYISLESFFEKYFSKEEYDLYLTITSEAVKQANEEIGLRTIRTMSGHNLSNFKASLSPLYATQSYQSMNYIFSSNLNKSTGFISTSDYTILNEAFLNNSLYRAFFCNEDFAKSFISSEYLFNTVGEKELFDYTSVICGYTKSIEQLIYKLLQINLLTLPSSNNLRIKSKNNSLIPFKKENEESFNTMLSSMINFLGHNKNGWNVSCDTYIISCLSDYKSSCRNEHFHKDNIYDYATVKRIRNNTILIFYYLLGGYKLTDDVEKNLELLGIESDSFDRLYKKINNIPRGQKRFIFQINSHEQKVIRLYNQIPPVYDENGSLKNSMVYFYPVETFTNKDYNYACKNIDNPHLLIMNNNNIPEKVWWYDINKNKRHLVEW